MWYVNLLGWVLYPIFKALGNKFPRCEQCKRRMERGRNPRLFLIPVYSDHDYQESMDYYSKNCVPIGSEAEIPTSRRACRFWELSCPECGARRIMVDDFLRVRDVEVIKKRSFYASDDYDELLLRLYR